MQEHRKRHSNLLFSWSLDQVRRLIKEGKGHKESLAELGMQLRPGAPASMVVAQPARSLQRSPDLETWAASLLRPNGKPSCRLQGRSLSQSELARLVLNKTLVAR